MERFFTPSTMECFSPRARWSAFHAEHGALRHQHCRVLRDFAAGCLPTSLQGASRLRCRVLGGFAAGCFATSLQAPFHAEHDGVLFTPSTMERFPPRARWSVFHPEHGRALFTPRTVARFSRQHDAVLFTPSTVARFSRRARWSAFPPEHDA